MREELMTGTSFNWLRVLVEAGDPAYAKFGPEELFTKRFPDKLKSSAPLRQNSATHTMLSTVRHYRESRFHKNLATR
jgi:hypothetical protein